MIKFGTDGWRAKIKEEFNEINVKKVAQGFANFLLKENSQPKVIIGFDNRYKSKESAIHMANVFVSSGIETYIVTESCPTPVVNFTLRELNLDAAVIITASHNPYEYNGIKIRLKGGIIPNLETTSLIEAEIKCLNEVKTMTAKELYNKLIMVDPFEKYINHIVRWINPEGLSYLNNQILVDSMHGATNKLIPMLFEKLGLQIQHIHNWRDYTFNYSQPEPVLPYVEEAVFQVKENKHKIGFAFDGDGDRIGVINEKGEYIPAHDIFLIVIYYLYKYHQQKGMIVKTISTSNKITEVSQALGFEILEVPVGFKYISERFNHSYFLFGGEESGGFTVKDHIPDKDGILIAILLLDCLRLERRTLSEILEEIKQYHQQWYFERIDIHVYNPYELMEKINSDKILSTLPISYDKKVKNEFGEWVLVRKSGTENVVRFYTEVKDKLKINEFKNYLKNF